MSLHPQKGKKTGFCGVSTSEIAEKRKFTCIFNDYNCNYRTALLACVLPANPEGPNAHTQKDEGCVQ